MIKCVLFDADGVTIQGEMFSVQYSREAGIKNEEMVPFFSGIYKECTVGRADLKEIIIPYLEKWNWKGSADDFLELWFNLESGVDENLVSLIYELKKYGVLCALSTNHEKYRVEHMRKQMRFGEIFDEIYASYSIGYRKEGNEFWNIVFRDLQNKVNCAKDEALVIDDTEKVIAVAKQFGFQAHLYTGLDSLVQKMKDIYVPRVTST